MTDLLSGFKLMIVGSKFIGSVSYSGSAVDWIEELARLLNLYIYEAHETLHASYFLRRILKSWMFRNHKLNYNKAYIYAYPTRDSYYIFRNTAI